MNPKDLLRSLLLALLLAAPAAAATDTLDFTGRLGAIAPENMVSEPGYYVWCGTGIRGEDGKYYLFYSRWKAGTEGRAPEDLPRHKDMAGWMKYCEIAAAVSDRPTGPSASTPPPANRTRFRARRVSICNSRCHRLNKWAGALPSLSPRCPRVSPVRS